MVAEFVQKSLLFGERRFRFEEDVLHYSAKSLLQTLSMSIAYFDLGVKRMVVRQDAGWASIMIWVTLSALVLHRFFSHFPWVADYDLYYVLFGVALILWDWKYTKTYVTRLMPENPASLEILHDGQRDAILAEMQNRQRDSIRKYFLKINPYAVPAHEIGKFKQLMESGFLSREDFEQLSTRILSADSAHTHIRTTPSGETIQ